MTNICDNRLIVVGCSQLAFILLGLAPTPDRILYIYSYISIAPYNPFAHAWMPLSQRELSDGAKRPVGPSMPSIPWSSLTWPPDLTFVLIARDIYRSGGPGNIFQDLAAVGLTLPKGAAKPKWQAMSSAFSALVGKAKKKGLKIGEGG